MKYLMMSLIILGCVSCAPFQLQVSILQTNEYILPTGSTSSNKVLSITCDDVKAYGNGNYVFTDQMLNLYKSPTTNSSNKLDATFPLIGGF